MKLIFRLYPQKCVISCYRNYLFRMKWTWTKSCQSSVSLDATKSYCYGSSVCPHAYLVVSERSINCLCPTFPHIGVRNHSCIISLRNRENEFMNK